MVPGAGRHPVAQTSWPVIEAHRAYIAAQLKVGVTVATVHQGLVDEHGLVVSVASLRRWVWSVPDFIDTDLDCQVG